MKGKGAYWEEDQFPKQVYLDIIHENTSFIIIFCMTIDFTAARK